MAQCSFDSNEPVFLSETLFKAVTVNETQFIFLDSVNLEINRYDLEMNYIDKIKIRRRYTSICYDNHENCYWAIANYNGSILFQLDDNFNEINQTFMRNVPRYNALSLSFDSSSRTLWVAYPDRIVYTDFRSMRYTYLENARIQGTYRGIAVLEKCWLTVQAANQKEAVHVIWPYDQEESIAEVPDEFTIEHLCIKETAASSERKEYQIYLLLTKTSDRAAYLMRCLAGYDIMQTQDENESRPGIEASEENETGTETGIGTEIGTGIETETGTETEQGTDTKTGTNTETGREPEIPATRNPESNPAQAFSAAYEMLSASGFGTNRFVKNPCEDCGRKCNKPSCCPDNDCGWPGGSCCQGCQGCQDCQDCPEKCSCLKNRCQIIYSIALEEAGISHILNAEGEKIQKAVAYSHSVKELLDINESVRETLKHVIQLEIQLNMKLEEAVRCTSCTGGTCCHKNSNEEQKCR